MAASTIRGLYVFREAGNVFAGTEAILLIYDQVPINKVSRIVKKQLLASVSQFADLA
jgi:hypothetical protein